MVAKKRLVVGVGYNDADYDVMTKTPDGKIWKCPFYKRWVGMLSRCYSQSELKRNPTYLDCTVCDEWLKFSNFRSWMALQDWKGNDLDKDLLIPGNRVYSPSTCVFVSRSINTFISTGSNSVSSRKIGVSYLAISNKFVAKCSDPIDGVAVYLGCYDTEDEAHEAWRVAKNEFAHELAEKISDQRVAEALRARYQ